MTPILLFGPAVSSYVRTARMVCLEKGVPHALEAVPGNEQLHPWKRVPILRHDDLTLYETSAILRYVDDIGPGPKLQPATPAERAVMEQWISAINCYVYDSLVKNYALRYILPKFAGKEPDLEQVRAGVPNLERDVARLDAGYARHAYLAGDAVSLADLLVGPIVQTVAMFPEGERALAAAPNLSRAYDLLRKRDAFATVHAKLFGG